MNERKQTILAFCIGEWATALDHLSVMHSSDDNIDLLDGQLKSLIGLWPDQEETDVVAAARTWLADHPEQWQELEHRTNR